MWTAIDGSCHAGRRTGNVATGLLGVVIVLGGCGGTPASSSPAATAATTPSAPAATAGAPAAPAATATTPEPTVTPAASFAGWSVPDGRFANVLAVGTDAKVYVATFEVDENQLPTNGTLVALGPDGVPLEGWSGPAIPAGHVVQDAAATADGGLYVVVGPGPGATGGALEIRRLSADGSTLGGWPVTLPVQGLRSRLQLSGDAVAFLWSADSMKASTLERIAPDGSRPAGWPVAIAGSRILLSRAGRDGTLYVDVSPRDDPWGANRVLAFAADGNAVPGWTPFKVKPEHHATMLPLSSSIVAATYSMGIGEADTLTWLAADGTPTGATAKGPKGMGSGTMDVAPDDTLVMGYYSYEPSVGMTGPGRVLALGPDGRSRDGWPVTLEGWPSSVVAGSDGTVWVLEVMDGSAGRVRALDAAGRLVAAPVTVGLDAFTTAVAGPDRVLYTTDRRDGATWVVALRGGS